MNTVSDLAGEHRVERPGVSPRHAALVTTITHEEQTDCIHRHHFICSIFSTELSHPISFFFFCTTACISLCIASLMFPTFYDSYSKYKLLKHQIYDNHNKLNLSTGTNFLLPVSSPGSEIPGKTKAFVPTAKTEQNTVEPAIA